MNSATRAKGNRRKGSWKRESGIVQASSIFQVTTASELSVLTPHKAGTTISTVGDRVILLWALCPPVLTSLSPAVGRHLGPLAAQGLTPTASPADARGPWPVSSPYPDVPEACSQLSKVKARIVWYINLGFQVNVLTSTPSNKTCPPHWCWPI